MKKKILSILLLLALVVGITGCGKKVELKDIVKKINNCETVKTYESYDYKVVASESDDKLTISGTMGEDKTTLEFKLDGNILSNESISNDNLMLALLVIDGVGQAHGYNDGQLSKNLNTFTEELKKYTLEKEGFEIVIGDESTSIKMDISKKVPLIDMNNYYLKTDDLDMISQIIAENTNGNQSGISGNIAYDIFIGDEESTIQIGQEKKLSDSAYKSILSALEVMYGKETAKHFQEIYPKFVSGKKTVEAFTIETNYKVEDQDESMFKDTKVVLVTINNEIIK